jgi:hypothetical protein
MHSLITIVGVVLTGKENYKEWYRKIKSTLIFNNLWNGICEATTVNEEVVESTATKDESEAKSKSSRPTIPTSNKERAIWKDKDKKAYAVIFATISEEVRRHIAAINDFYSTLKRLNDLYDTHSELELIQLFNLELKNDDPMALASEIEAIMHDIDAIWVKIDLPFTTFIKALYPTYSHYLESLQASGQMKCPFNSHPSFESAHLSHNTIETRNQSNLLSMVVLPDLLFLNVGFSSIGLISTKSCL